MTPAQSLMDKYATLQEAANILEQAMQDIEDENPDAATWATVGKYTQLAERAALIIEEFSE